MWHNVRKALLPLFTLPILLLNSGCLITAGINVPDRPGDPSALALSFLPISTISTYTCTPVTVQSLNSQNVPVKVDQNIAVGLFGLGSGSAFNTLSDCHLNQSSTSVVFISTGQNQTTFYFRTAQAETLHITAQASGFLAGALPVSAVLFQVLGQPSPHSYIQFEQGMAFSQSAFSDGIRLFVSDASNSRVLVWNHLPTSNGQPADFALGQPNLYSTYADNGGISASSLNNPKSVFSDGTRLFVVDSGNHRVLVWNTLPTSNGQPANFALGQPDLVTGTVQRSNNGDVTAWSLFYPNGVFSDGTRLFVADAGNARVLVWNTAARRRTLLWVNPILFRAHPIMAAFRARP